MKQMKTNHDLEKEVSEYLNYFCKELPGRSVGSEVTKRHSFF
jgi:hypothetical protein